MEDLAVFTALNHSGSFGKNLFKFKQIYVIYRLRVGSYGEKLWRPRSQFSPYRPPSRQIIYVYIEHRAELKLSRHLPNCTISGTFLHVFFFWKWNFGTVKSANSIWRTQTKVCKHARRRNWRYYNVSRDENPQKVKETDSPSFEGFHTQLDYKRTYGNKNQTQLTLVQCI